MHATGPISCWTGRLALICLSLTLSSCLYFNTWWNAQKAYDQAERQRLRRFHKNPDDTTKVTKDETDLYQRAIAKASKVIETFPQDTTWHDRSLMLIALSQQRLFEYEKASRKYGELVDAFPWSPLYQEAVEGNIECLLALGRYSDAEDWMRRLDSTKAAGGPAGMLWLKARVALGRFDTAGARTHLEKLVAMRKVEPVTRHGEAALLLGNLAWAQRDWQAARSAFLHPAIVNLPRISRFRARLRAVLCLDRLDQTAQARLALDSLSQEKFYSRERPYVYLEWGRMLLARKLYGDGIPVLQRLEEYTEPPEAVAEGLLIAGQDAQKRRVDYPEAMRLYDLAAKAGPETEYGKTARDLADALADLMNLRKRTVPDSSMENWTFDLAELHLLRLGNYDSARAAYGRILAHPGASYETRARAAYAMTWIDEKTDSSKAVWAKMADQFPGTEFAKQAQKNAGIPVTVRTRADSSESAYRLAEALWDTTTPNYAASDSAFRGVVRDWKGTVAAKRARFASAWIEDNLLSDSAAAIISYKLVVDSLPGTNWAKRAAGILEAVNKGPESLEFRKRNSDAPDGSIQLEEDFEEGSETMGGTGTAPTGGRKSFGPQPPSSPSLKSPGEPDAIPPTPEGGYLSPDDFQ